MNIIYDNQTFTRNQLIENFELNNVEIDNLIIKGIFLQNRDETISIYFVGLIITKNNVIHCLPKFFIDYNLENLEDFSFYFIQEILEKYNERYKKNLAIKPDLIKELRFFDEEYKKEYEIYITLIKDFKYNQLYKKNISINQQRQLKRINWKRTTLSSLAIHTNKTTFYPNPVLTGYLKKANIITMFHASILNYLTSRYGSIRDKNIINELKKETDFIDQENLMNNRLLYASMVEKELKNTFNSNDINILKLLHFFLYQDDLFSGPIQIRIFGTNFFNIIWEDACSYVFNNEYKEIDNRISQPSWLFYSDKINEEILKPGGKQRPDIIIDKDKYTLILDAKYYYKLPESTCGWQDLVKQFFYQESFDNLHNKIIINGLLFPDLGVEDINCVGEIKMLKNNGEYDIRFKPIFIFKVNPTLVFKAYINNKILKEYTQKLINIINSNILLAQK